MEINTNLIFHGLNNVLIKNRMSYLKKHSYRKKLLHNI